MPVRITRLIALAFVIAGMNASAQNFPARPIRIVVGFIAGSGVDVSGRIVAQFLSEGFDQQVIVENKADIAGWLPIIRASGAITD